MILLQPFKLGLCTKILQNLSAILKLRNMPRQASSYKVLNVAEKNDAAKRISEILSNRNSQRREGFSKFNKIYEFNHSMLGQDCQMLMTSLSGHLQNYAFTGCYRKWTSCHPSSLFTAEIEKKVTENMVNIKRTLEKECRSCQALVIWTDGDREGENIGYEIINVCLAIKPNLNVYRAKFSEITDRSIQAACRNLVQPNQNVSDAVDVRQEIDLRTGAAFTRFQTLRLQKVFPQVLSERLISYGSCQFPTLGFIVERYKAREEFQPEAFWKIEVSHLKDECNANFSWKRNRLFQQIACQVLYDQCKEDPAIATVTNINSKPKSKWRPVAMDTVELEKLASRKLHISARETMQIAEKLYTKGYISYPRTETNSFAKDIDLNRLIDEQANESKVYELIARHFLACCHRDAKGHETTVEIELGGEKFSAQGLMIIERNYLEIYIYEKWNAKTIPIYQVGEQFDPTRIEMTEGATTAPNLLSEADLISLMEKHGIGTDATHAEHIETIKSRMYAGMTPDRRFLPGELGMGLVEGYNLMGYALTKPERRAALESDLKLICDGRARKEEVLEKHIRVYKEVFESVIQQGQKLDEALGNYFGNAESVANQNIYNPMEVSAPVRPCHLCGKDMVIKKKKDGGLMISCMGYPDCRHVAFLPRSVLSATVDESVCPTCRPAPVHRIKLKLDRRSIPPFMDPDTVACICGCDEDITNVLDVRFRTLGSSSNSTSSSRTGGGYSNHGGYTGPGQGGNSGRGGYSGPGRGGNSGRGGYAGPGRGGNSGRGGYAGPGRGGNTGRGGYSSSQGPGFLARPGGGRGEGMGRGGGGGRGRMKRTSSGQKKTYSTSSYTSDSGVESGTDSSNRFSSTSSSNNQDTENHPLCRCTDVSVIRTVMKDGPNKGRQFHTCSKPRGEQCGFFEWADAMQQAQNYSSGAASFQNNNRGGYHNNRGRGRGSSQYSRGGGGGARRPGKCSLCREPGHTKRNCPNK